MRSVRRRAITGLAIVSTAAFIGGCSGGDDDNGDSGDTGATPTEMVETTEEATALDEDELIDMANEICADVGDELDELGDPASDDPDDLVEFIDAGLELQEGGIEELEALAPPEEIADDYEEAVGLLDDQRSAIEDARDRIDGGEDPEEVFADVNDEVEGLEGDADAILEDLGLDECLSDDNGSEEETETQTAPALTSSEASSTPFAPIPDDDPQGVADTVTIEATGIVQAISVGVDVTHPFSGDLVVTLTAPTGEEAVLSDRDGGSDDDLALRLDASSSELAPLLGVPAEGDWQLRVVDLTAQDEGTFDRWLLEIEAG